jgi:hypothetical protein
LIIVRDHRPIIGDLIEEYREVVLPARGRTRAAAWFVGQLLSLVRPWTWGVLTMSNPASVVRKLARCSTLTAILW